MQTTYRLKAKEINMSFVKSLKSLFEGQEVEIIVKSVGHEKEYKATNAYNGLLQMIKDNRENAPVISQDVNVHLLIDNAHNPGNI